MAAAAAHNVFIIIVLPHEAAARRGAIPDPVLFENENQYQIQDTTIPPQRESPKSMCHKG
ncbi:MAG: hypothetical protein ACRERC_19240 [Candidatus Binatia bacterium]